MTTTTRWIVQIGAVLVAVPVYGVWRSIDQSLHLGIWSAFLRGGVVLGGMAWALDMLAAFPSIRSTEDDNRLILWTTDPTAFRVELAQLRARLGVELCAEPEPLRGVR